MIANQFVSRMDIFQRKQTLITFNNGAHWQKLQAPAVVNGVSSNCVLVRYNDYYEAMHLVPLIGYVSLCELAISTIMYFLSESNC